MLKNIMPPRTQTPPGLVPSVVSGPMSTGQARAARACAVGSGLQDQFPPQEGAKAPSTVECLSLGPLSARIERWRRMLTTSTLLHVVRPGDWFTSIDLKDAYFHIPIYPPHRKFLRFAFQGRMYEYQVLPFGLSLSPRVFVKCTEAAIAPLKRRGIRIATYIDDWLLLSESEIMGREHTRLAVDHLMALGFTINYERSVLQPAQAISFIGIALNSASYRACPSVDRVKKKKKCYHMPAFFRWEDISHSENACRCWD